MRAWKMVGILLALFAAGAPAANAGITTYVGTQMVTEFDRATFDSIIYGSPIDLSNYQEAGLSITVNNVSFGSGWYYANGGAREPYVIQRVDGSDFACLEMDTNTGFVPGTRYWWLQIYDDGVLLDNAHFDIAPLTHIGIIGQFDEVRIGAFADAATRDAHDWSQLNAASLDNVAYGLAAQVVPLPGALLLGLVGLTAASVLRRRR